MTILALGLQLFGPLLTLTAALAGAGHTVEVRAREGGFIEVHLVHAQQRASRDVGTGSERAGELPAGEPDHVLVFHGDRAAEEPSVADFEFPSSAMVSPPVAEFVRWVEAPAAAVDRRELPAGNARWRGDVMLV